MVSLDLSIIPAILIFLTLVFALNSLLFKPIMKIQAERESRSSGLIDRTRKGLAEQEKLFREYEAKITQARSDGYRLRDQRRDDATRKRAESLDAARSSARGMTETAKKSIRLELEAAKSQMAAEAEDVAARIMKTVLRRSA